MDVVSTEDYNLDGVVDSLDSGIGIHADVSTVTDISRWTVRVVPAVGTPQAYMFPFNSRLFRGERCLTRMVSGLVLPSVSGYIILLNEDGLIVDEVLYLTSTTYQRVPPINGAWVARPDSTCGRPNS